MAINSTVNVSEQEVPPVGDYDAEIIKSEDAISKKTGVDMIKLTIKTDKGLVWYYLSDDEYLQDKCRHIFLSAGIIGQNITVNSAEFRGLKIRIRIKHEMYDNKLSAKIEKFLPPENRPTAPATSGDIPF